MDVVGVIVDVVGDFVYFVSTARFAHSAAACYLGEQQALIVRINYRMRIIRDENEEGEASGTAAHR